MCSEIDKNNTTCSIQNYHPKNYLELFALEMYSKCKFVQKCITNIFKFSTKKVYL